MSRYSKPTEPRVPTDHFTLLVKTAIAEGVQLSQDPIDYSESDSKKYRLSVVREDNTVDYVWLPVRTFNDPELLAGAIRPWRHEPEEHAKYMVEWEAARARPLPLPQDVPKSPLSYAEQREAKRLSRRWR
jgi:hypothetical protein